MRIIGKLGVAAGALCLFIAPAIAMVGVEVAVPQHLQDGEEFAVSLKELLAHGFKLFTANWTIQEGGGRPLTKGTGGPCPIPQSRSFFRAAITVSQPRMPTRVPADTDPDGDGVLNEMTRADVTASVIFQATLAVPGRVIPNDPEIEEAVYRGETLFADIGCTTCHVPSLPLDKKGWIYTEPNPFNPPGNLQSGETDTYRVDLTSNTLPRPRLQPQHGVVQVPAHTDLKLHDITSGPGCDYRVLKNPASVTARDTPSDH